MEMSRAPQVVFNVMMTTALLLLHIGVVRADAGFRCEGGA